jgi:hypothetical protein
MPSPHEVLQAFLDEVGRATIQGDWDAYRAGIALPFELTTAAACLRIDTEADLRLGFDQFVGMLRGLHVTDYVRLVRWAREAGPAKIEGEYDNHLIAGGHRAVPPFRSAMTIVEGGGRWRAVRVRTELSNARWPLGIPTPLRPDGAGG